MAPTEINTGSPSLVEKGLDGFTASAGKSPEPEVGPTDGEQSAPEIPPKSPLRASRNRGDRKPNAVKDSQGSIPASIVSRTQGRVKQLTAELEQKKNLHLKMYDWTGDLSHLDNREKAGPVGSS